MLFSRGTVVFDVTVAIDHGSLIDHRLSGSHAAHFAGRGETRGEGGGGGGRRGECDLGAPGLGSGGNHHSNVVRKLSEDPNSCF